MSKWQKLKHRIHLATSAPWFITFEKDLARIGIKSPSIVFDVGAHHGQTTLHFRKIFPSAAIHSFEPSPENFRKLKSNTKGKDRVKPNELALGSSAGSVSMERGHSDQAHKVCSDAANAEMPTVRMETVDSYMNKARIPCIDLLKIDVEGYEIEVLRGAANAIEGSNIKVILAECDFNPEDTQHTYFNDLWNYLRSKDFSFFGLYDVIHYEGLSGIGYCNALFIERTVSLNGH